MNFKTLIKLGVDRNILVYDSNDTSHCFSKRLLGLINSTIKTNSKDKKGVATDIFLSSMEYFSVTFSEIFDSKTRFYGIESLSYQKELHNYFIKDLCGSMTYSDIEFGIALDLSDGFEKLFDDNIEIEKVLLFSY